jgi:diguanylate cyclase (GGDEF)-like protein
MCDACRPAQPAGLDRRPGDAPTRSATSAGLLVLSLLVAMLVARTGWAMGDQSVLFAVPMLIAAHRYPQRFVAILALLCICLDRGIDWRLHGVGHPWRLTELLLVCISLLAVALASQRQQTAARAQEGEDAIRRLQHLAWHDALTGLPNRAYFLDHLSAALERSQAAAGEPFAVLFIDCDGFKRVNDAYGHAIGDQLLRALGERLQGCLGEHDLAARLGGDEFAVLLRPLPDGERAEEVAALVARRLAAPFPIGASAVTITASIGSALSSAGYDRPEAVLHDADLEMYEAKRRIRRGEGGR